VEKKIHTLIHIAPLMKMRDAEIKFPIQEALSKNGKATAMSC
jgi:hypothetical protein